MKNNELNIVWVFFVEAALCNQKLEFESNFLRHVGDEVWNFSKREANCVEGRGYLKINNKLDFGRIRSGWMS